jgi:hypothetical protein
MDLFRGRWPKGGEHIVVLKIHHQVKSATHILVPGPSGTKLISEIL